MTTVHKCKPYADDTIYVGRPTVFSNPFEIGRDGDRDEVITKFRQYFYDRLKYDSKFKNMVIKLKDKKLGCYCKPLPCHGDVIAEYLDTL